MLFQRLTQDLKSNVHQVDVFASTDEAHMTILKKQNALAQFVPADIDKIPAQYQHLDPDDAYQLGDIALMLHQLQPEERRRRRKRWNDLLDPKYKGQLTVGHPGFSGYVGNWVVAMNDKFGWDAYFKKFAANKPKIGRSVFDATTDIVSGERRLGAGRRQPRARAQGRRQQHRDRVPGRRHDPGHRAGHGDEGSAAPQRRAAADELLLFARVLADHGEDVQSADAARRRRPPTASASTASRRTT